MFVQISGNARSDLLALKSRTLYCWRDKPNWYWAYRLLQEVFELLSSLLGIHKHIPEHELLQIACICWNWVELLYSKKDGAK